MGSSSDEQDRYPEEGPRHQVTISKAFYMGKYEVTQAQWQAVMGTGLFDFGNDADYPKNLITWGNCQKFIERLNTMGIGTYRLPTEAEWEYACRAGSTTRFSFGDDTSYSLIEQYAWYGSNSSNTEHAVGQKWPNAWGLYDMHGNVWEWCSDWYGSYSAGAQTDPKGATSGTGHVVRGGCYGNYAWGCRSANRHRFHTWDTSGVIGFRLVRTQ